MYYDQHQNSDLPDMFFWALDEPWIFNFSKISVVFISMVYESLEVVV